MSKNKILSFVALGAAAVLLISLFLPYVSFFSESRSLWKIEDPSRVLILLMSIFVALLYAINKKTELCYLVAGYVFFYLITMVISAEGLDYFSIGFYLMLLSSATIGVVTYLYDEKKGEALLNLNVNMSVNKPQINNVAPQNNDQNK